MIEIEGIEGFRALIGQHVGWTDYEEITQEQVNQFADATGDHQWIHVDVERANRESPFGGPIAHGYLVLSLIPRYLPKLWRVKGFRHGVNYGSEKVRFPSPVPVGAKLRCGATIDSVEEVGGGFQVAMTMTFETEGATKPSCVATVIFRYFV